MSPRFALLRFPPGRHGWLRLLALTMGLGLVIGAIRQEWRSETDLAARGAAALKAEDLTAATAWADRLLRQNPSAGQGLWLKGQIAERQGWLDEAIEWLDRIDAKETPLFETAHQHAGELAYHKIGDYALAESLFRQAAEADRGSAPALRRLTEFLGLQSRCWEALPYRIALMRQTPPTAAELFLVSLGDRALADPQAIEEFCRSNPDEAGAQLAWGRVLAARGQADSARRLFQGAARSERHRAESCARWGELWEGLATPAEARAWEQFAETTSPHPGVWQVRGAQAEARADAVTAARCYAAAARMDGERAVAFYRLGQLLVRLGRETEGERCLERARRLEEYAKSAELAYRVGEAQHLQRAIVAAEACGLMVEAWGWAVRLDAEYPSATTRPQVERLLGALPPVPAVRSDERWNPARAIDLSSLDQSVTLPNPAASQPSSDPGVPLLFEETTVDFQYDNGGDPARGLVRMYEITGGGVAVLDYDLDSHPDLYLPQGGTWDAGDSRPQTDRLFRLSEVRGAVDVTESARLSERGFSVGATVGDFDNDGFPDVYVTNAGQNRLFHNLGDGTFVERSQAAGLIDNDYSASAVLADLSGDGLADLYVVNYLAGEDLWTRVCGGADGIPRSCLPQSFPAARDRFWWNRGDGRFTDESARSGVGELAGKGLGIVAADFAQRGQLDLYIANDVGPNFLLERTGVDDSGVPRFQDIGLVSGVALDGQGHALSSMGVTAGDADGDGRLDLFVTNFEQEASSFYRQIAPLQFVETTAAQGLVDKPLALVGWGTQWFDADLDGHLDLALTNGHVNNLADHGKPYRMPSRLFRNRGDGRMQMDRDREAGDYFSRLVLGRGMARWDGDRDGREDLVVTHLDRPPVLLWNRTPTTHHGMGFVLTAVQGQRDAIGATVTVRTARGTMVRQLTAGDGNQSTNQRRLLFGLGEQDRILGVAIVWPNGTRQECGPLAVDTEYRWIEGGVPIPIFRWRPSATLPE